MSRDIDHVVSKIRQWHHDRNLVQGSTDAAQFIKLLEEVDELKGFIDQDGSNFEDHVGDIIVVLINLCERNGTNLETCLNVAYNDIQHRSGIMHEGIFIKSTDVRYESILALYDIKG